MPGQTALKQAERTLNAAVFRIGTALSPVLHGRDLGNRLKHGPGAPKMYQTLYVNPRDVEFMLHGKVPGTRRIKREESGRVLGGDWEDTIVRINDFPKAQYLHRHFVDGLSWEDCGAYDFLMTAIETHGHGDGIKTREGMIRRYDALQRTFEDMKATGQLKSRRQLKGGSLREKGGITMHVGRDGTPIFGGGGTHRLVMSQILGLPRIPTQLGVTHPDAIASGAFAALKSRVPQDPQR